MILVGLSSNIWYLKIYRIRCMSKDMRFVLDCDKDLEYFNVIIGSTMQYWRDDRNIFGFI